MEAKEKYTDLECVKQDIELMCSGNFNNILSISSHYRWEYKDEKGELGGQGLAHEPIFYSQTATYNNTGSTGKVQDFINVRIYENTEIYSEKTDTSYLSGSRQILRCYRKGSNEPANIRDIFVEGVDVEKTLEKLVYDKLEIDQQKREESGYPRSIDVAAHAQGAVNKFVGFCVNHESIFAEYGKDSRLASYVIELKYTDIGSENLNIFD